MDKMQPGLIYTPEIEEQLKKLYKFSETVSSTAPVEWREKPKKEWRKFPIYDQDGSGSCVAQTLRKLYGIYIQQKTGVYVDLSASHIYQRRINRPEGGMAGTDAFEIGRKGTTLNIFAPSDNMNDAKMDVVKVLPFMEEIGKVFKLGNYMSVDRMDIDTLASIIQTTGKGIMLWFYFKRDEWQDMPVVKYPNLNRYASTTVRHSVPGHDFTLYKGKKAIIVDESWGIGTAVNGQRIITQDFLDKRCFFVGHFQNFAFEQASIPKPRYDGSIVSLQDCLKYDGVFPANVESTGVYGEITRKAVSQFQVKYGLHATGTGEVGPLTKAKLEELFP